MDILNRRFISKAGDFEETKRAVESAESRARVHQRKNEQKHRGNDRQYALALHREADQLYQNGDYETALVLYHRAASLCPRDSSHDAAARRTAAVLSSWNNPPRIQRKKKLTPSSESQVPLTICPELAAVKAKNLLKESSDAFAVAEALRYFDHHQSYWRTSPAAKRSKERAPVKVPIPRQLGNLVSMTLKNLEASFSSGKTRVAQAIAEELLTLSCTLPEPHRYQILAHNYLTLIHVTLGRHDRAIASVSHMIRLSKATGDSVLMSRALTALGKVHLSFGHLDALARAWEHLSENLKESIPRAWIHHEIGRCWLETGKHGKALEMARVCVEIAEEANSKKWMLRGRLLSGQALVKMERLAEGLEELRIAAKITEEEGDTPTLSYVRELIDQITLVLRGITFSRKDEHGMTSISRRSCVKLSSGEKDSGENDESTNQKIEDQIQKQKCEEETRNLGNNQRSDSHMSTLEKFRSSLMPQKVSQLDTPAKVGAPTGGSTFRIETAIKSDLSSPDTITPEESADSDAENRTHPTNTSRSNQLNATDSTVSLKTNATYVIAKTEDNEGAGSISKPSEETFEAHAETEESETLNSASSVNKDVKRSNSEGKDEWLENIELLGKRLQESEEGREDLLLRMIGQMLSMSKAESLRLGNHESDSSGTTEGFETSRSFNSAIGKTYGKVNARSLYGHSLPSSPRKEDHEKVRYSGCVSESGDF